MDINIIKQLNYIFNFLHETNQVINFILLVMQVLGVKKKHFKAFRKFILKKIYNLSK